MLGFIPPCRICQVLVDESGGRNPETRLRAPPGVQTAACASLCRQVRASLHAPGLGPVWFFPAVGQVLHWKLSLVDQNHPGDFLVKAASFDDQNIERHCPPPTGESSVPGSPTQRLPHVPAETKLRDCVAVCVSLCWMSDGYTRHQKYLEK